MDTILHDSDMADDSCDPPDPRHPRPGPRRPSLVAGTVPIERRTDVARLLALDRIRREENARNQAILDQHEKNLLEAEREIVRLITLIGSPRLSAILERKAIELEA